MSDSQLGENGVWEVGGFALIADGKGTVCLGDSRGLTALASSGSPVTAARGKPS